MSKSKANSQPPKKSPRPSKSRKPTAKQIRDAEAWWSDQEYYYEAKARSMTAGTVATTTWTVNNPHARPPVSSPAYRGWVLEVNYYLEIGRLVGLYRPQWDETERLIGLG